MLCRPGFITNSSGSSFVVVTRSPIITKAFLAKVGMSDFFWDGSSYGGSNFSITLTELAEMLMPDEEEKKDIHRSDAYVNADCIDEIISDLEQIIPDAVARIDGGDSEMAKFYQDTCAAWDRMDDVYDLWQTYQNLLKMGYYVFHRTSSDDNPGKWAAMDMITNKTYVCRGTQEFVTKTSHH